MSLKNRLRPIHMQLRNNSLYEGLYLLFRPAARANLTPRPRLLRKKASDTQKTAWESEGAKRVIEILIAEGDYSAAQIAIDSMLESGELWSTAVAWEMSAKILLSKGNHEELLTVTTHMTENLSLPHGHYYAAQSYYVRGLYQAAIHSLQSSLFALPNHEGAILLFSDVAQQTNNSQSSRKLLHRFMLDSASPQGWLAVANLVETVEDYMQMKAAWTLWTEKFVKNSYSNDACSFLAIGAARVGNYEEAHEIWRNSLLEAARSRADLSALSIRKHSFSSKLAPKALASLKVVLDDAKIEVFLVGETLLSYARGNQTYDRGAVVDVGIWSESMSNGFLELLINSGQFMILPHQSRDVVQLKHVNGILIDVSLYHQGNEHYFHADTKVRWSKTPFKLTKCRFWDATYLIPDDYETFLWESFGDWRVFEKPVDSVLNAKERTVLNEAELLIHTFSKLYDACNSNLADATSFYLDCLVQQGESTFVDIFSNCMTEVGSQTTTALRVP